MEFSKNTINETQFKLQIFNLVKGFYNELPDNVKLKKDEWSVFAAVIVEKNDYFQVTSFGLGTKSLGNKNYCGYGHRINDCHAEILAIKAFRRFVMRKLIEKISNIEDDGDFYKDFIILNQNTSKFKINSIFNFHLFISETPCGDCSLYPVTFKENTETNRIGAKSVKEVIEIFQNQSKQNNIPHNNDSSIIRIKSCRSDTKIENISLSLSCSDKIMRKNILGIQGIYLSTCLKNFYFSSITICVGQEFSDEYLKENKFEGIINRGINLIERKKINLYDFNTNNIKLGFNIPKISIMNKNFFELNHPNPRHFNFGYYWYLGKNEIGRIDPSSGLKQGSNKSDPNLFKYSVDISDYNLRISFFQLLQNYIKSSLNIKHLEKVSLLIEKLLIEENISLLSITKKKFSEITKKYKYNQRKEWLERFLELQDFYKLKNKIN